MSQDETRDSIARGRLVLRQPRLGYRFNVDSVILAGFASPPGERVCDIGTGSGIVGLWLAKAGAAAVVGLEVQSELARLARVNALENDLESRFAVVEGDARAYGRMEGADRFDHVVSNPPFAELGSGRVDSNPQRAIARHEICLSLNDVFEVAARLLCPGGRLSLIHRADREGDLLDAAKRSGLVPVRLRRVSPRLEQSPTRVLMEARRLPGELGEPELVVEPPLVMHEPSGAYAPEVSTLLGD